jgi:hypothetical protein
MPGLVAASAAIAAAVAVATATTAAATTTTAATTAAVATAATRATAATAVATATTGATTATTVAAATTARLIFARYRFVDPNGASIQGCAIHLFDGGVHVLMGELHKAEAAVGDHLRADNFEAIKRLFQSSIRSAVGKISDKESFICH